MQESASNVSTLIRATIFVRDLQKSTEFYRALGLNDSYYEGILDHSSASTVLGFKQHYAYPIKILKVTGPNFGMIGLFQLSPKHLAVQAPITIGPARIGEVALVFYVSSLDEILPTLKSLGAFSVRKPTLFKMGAISQREVCLRDLDGTLLNLVERSPEFQNLTNPEMDF